ncbi:MULTISPECIES: hypothetical protein [unclassified Rathayibacter]|uniref:hypothetical protein n=1 Tax=unclassified Rathayibacter TaxID=2609250 RepID=UPI00188CE03A|nr:MULTISPECIES: hypothetical protein [unclassified Rathayibacter]MBF4461381.1 hypothetical protein [Rathayibacter sp. VKM Ac-2879]MBF4502792.1 hypothetical protein [Rathayibacter sp. VKM Ac-2878]
MKRARVAAVLVSALMLAGCSASDPSIQAGTAQTLDDAVVAVAERAAADDYTGALRELDSLQSALDQAVAAATISAERASLVQARVDTVRADLEGAIGATPGPSPSPTSSEEPNGEQETSSETPVASAPQPEETDDDAPAPTPEDTEPVDTPEPSTAPGNSGEAPGNGGDAPGNSGDAPGNSGNAPGNSGDAPGNGKGPGAR